MSSVDAESAGMIARDRPLDPMSSQAHGVHASSDRGPLPSVIAWPATECHARTAQCYPRAASGVVCPGRRQASVSRAFLLLDRKIRTSKLESEAGHQAHEILLSRLPRRRKRV
jgi:hypothetical protein